MPVKLNLKQLIRDKQAKEKREITMSDVASHVKIGRNGLYHYINGNSKAFELLEALCDYFNCEPGDLLVRTTEKDKPDV